MNKNNQHPVVPQQGGLRVADSSNLKVARTAPTISYTFSDGSLSKWDVPTWQVKVVESKYRYPMAKYAVQAKHSGVLTKNDHQILLTIAMAKAITEEQIRRACKPLTNSMIYKRVDLLEVWGLVERRKFTAERNPNEKYPGIITLTDTGKDYIRLTAPGTHCLGSSDYLRYPKLPINLIGSNEIKLQLMEANALISWTDHKEISSFGKVACSATIALPDGRFHLLMDRISGMSKVDHFLHQRIASLTEFAQRGEKLLDENFAYVFIVPSNSSITQLIQAYEIHHLANSYRDYYPHIWFISHEHLFSPLGIEQGIIALGKSNLEAVRLPFGNADDYADDY